MKAKSAILNVLQDDVVLDLDQVLRPMGFAHCTVRQSDTLLATISGSSLSWLVADTYWCHLTPFSMQSLVADL